LRNRDREAAMINGAHVVIYSKDADADRAFFRDILKFDHVDAGQGWLIFKLPPCEIAMHPSGENDKHQFYLMCDDVDAEIARLASAGVPCEPVTEVGWGRLTGITLPGGGKLGMYQPRHARP
jgi:catechol 2,3-dioxygenase-like lactoylglutathione lyase family enzyme